MHVAEICYSKVLQFSASTGGAVCGCKMVVVVVVVVVESCTELAAC